MSGRLISLIWLKTHGVMLLFRVILDSRHYGDNLLPMGGILSSCETPEQLCGKRHRSLRWHRDEWNFCLEWTVPLKYLRINSSLSRCLFLCCVSPALCLDLTCPRCGTTGAVWSSTQLLEARLRAAFPRRSNTWGTGSSNRDGDGTTFQLKVVNQVCCHTWGQSFLGFF